MIISLFKNFNRRNASTRFFLLSIVATALILGSGGLRAAPTISEFSPLWGTPGTQVTITGFGFFNATQVEFGDQRPADFQIISDNTLTVVVPPDGLTALLKVTSPTGSGTSPDSFFVSPRIDNFSPAQGTSGTTVTINGANFLQNGTWVVFGSVTSLVVNVTAPTQLQTSVPEGATNSIIYVYTGAGSATSIVEFVSSTAPLIKSFSPENGLAGTGLPVVIDGANLLGTTNVSFNGTNASFSITAETQIQTSVPVGANTGPIRVGTSSGEAFSPTDFIVGPTITSFQPLAGQVGEWIVVNGNDFTGLTNVTINGVQVVEGNEVAPTQLSIRVPEGATTGKIRVGTGTGEGFSKLNFTVGPFIQSFDPRNGPVGTSVTIRGAGFDQSTLVFFGTIQSPNVNSPAPNLINAVVPSGATNGPIHVVSGTSTNTTVMSFLVTAGEPVIERVNPGFGVRGAEIDLSGVGFSGITSVTFGGVQAGFVAPAASTQMKVIVPPGALTGPIVVFNASGSGTSPGIFYPPPWTTSFSPAAAIADTIVEIRGTNFVDATGVFFGGERGQLLVVESGQIFALLTANARTGPVQINTPGGSFITASNFTVLPFIQEIDPTIGPVGTPVKISGTSFFNVTNVAFNGTAATFTNVSPQEIRANVPEGATSGLIRVGTLDGETFSPGPFTVTFPSDLAVSETTSTNLVLPGETVTYVSVVTNRGPSDVTFVTLTNTFDVAAELLSATASSGGCEIQGNVVSCALGVLLTNSTASVTIRATLPVSGVYENTVEADSFEGDPQNGNNTAQSVVVAVTDDERTLNIELLSAADQAVVSWKISPVPFQLQFIREFGNTNVNWSNFLGAPFMFNGTNRVTNGTAFPQESYRLVY